MKKEATIPNFSVQIASVYDREKLIAEVYYKDEQWAKLSQDQPDVKVLFFAPINQPYWEFSYAEAIKALEWAKNELING